MTVADIRKKRSMLLSARIRLSPQAQPVRELAIDKIVEQNLLIGDTGKSMTLEEIQKMGTVCFAGGAPAITRPDMQNSLHRLVEKGRVSGGRNGPDITYKLSDEAKEDLWQLEKVTETRFSSVVSRLFRNTEEGLAAYSTPFLECLCIIFSELGENYVRLLKGEITQNDLIASPTLVSAVGEIKSRYANKIDGHVFEVAVCSFFKDTDPDYDAIKWNMAQNYYVAKALGLDPGGQLLSEEVFGNSEFYLDTNVLIAALESTARHHRSFQALSKACQNLNIQLNVCQISLDELRKLIEYNRDLISKVSEQIPELTGAKVKGIFYQLYRDRLRESGEADLDDLFSVFVDPMPTLGGMYQVNLIDDRWFLSEEKEVRTSNVMQLIRKQFLKSRGREKGIRSATHDALLLRWIEKARKETTEKAWLVTLDTSLPTIRLGRPEGNGRALAIGLDAFLQWISPISATDDVGDAMASIFSQAMKYRLLPQDTFFDLRDFLVFAEMEWTCKELPAEDVEGCIRHVKALGPDLDPASPRDREKVAREISRFFADPSRKYKTAIQSMENDTINIIEESETRLQQERAARKADQETIRSLQSQIIESGARARQREIRSSAFMRLSWCIAIFVLLEVGILYAADLFGVGKNFGEKAWASGEWLGLGALVGITASWFTLGRERIRALGWPFTKIFKEE